MNSDEKSLPAWMRELVKCSECGGTAMSIWFDKGNCVGAQCRSCQAWVKVED